MPKPWLQRWLAPARSWAVPGKAGERKRLAFDLLSFAGAKLLLRGEWGNMSMKKPQSSQSLVVTTHLTWIGEGISCFLHLSIDENIMPNPYPKI